MVQLAAATFPRSKPCGGGMTIKARHALQLELGASITGTCAAVEANYWRASTRRYTHRGPIRNMVSRAQFDNRLVERNRRWPGSPSMTGEGRARATLQWQVDKTRAVGAGAVAPRPPALRLRAGRPGHPRPNLLKPCPEWFAVQSRIVAHLKPSQPGRARKGTTPDRVEWQIEATVAVDAPADTRAVHRTASDLIATNV